VAEERHRLARMRSAIVILLGHAIRPS
jgi:hypothetical protein